MDSNRQQRNGASDQRRASPWVSSGRVRPAVRLLLLVLLLTCGRTASGLAQPVTQALVTVGTVAHDGLAQPWAYLVWDRLDEATAAGPGAAVPVYAVYRKPGPAQGPGSYHLESIVSRLTDPALVGLALQRAVHLGQDTNELRSTLGNLFHLPADLPLTQAIVASLQLPGNAGSTVGALGRAHPAIQLSLGQAWAGPLPELSTFELRAYDPAKQQSYAVVGRITLDPDNPPQLAAPDQPTELPDPAVTGHRSVKLRWGVPPALAQTGLLLNGFAVYRIERSLAEAQGFHSTPPSATQLLALVLANGEHARRINQVPLVPPELLPPAAAGNPAIEPGLSYFIDDFTRAGTGAALLDGVEFYYFVAGLDLLGRPGAPSPGRLVKVCDRDRPQIVGGVRVLNDHVWTAAGSRQALRVVWEQPAPNGRPRRYWVHRAASAEALRAPPESLLPFRIGPATPAAAGSAELGQLDDGTGAPTTGANLGETFWYSVVVEEEGACGPLWSHASPPVFGVLRDREGPAAPEGFVELNCPRPALSWDGNPTAEYRPDGRTPPDTEAGVHWYQLMVTAPADAAQWVEFFVLTPNPLANQSSPDRLFLSETRADKVGGDLADDPVLAAANLPALRFLGRHSWPDGADRLEVAFRQREVPGGAGANAVRFFARWGGRNGRVSVAATTEDVRVPSPATARAVKFAASWEANVVRLTEGATETTCAHPPGAGGIRLQFGLAPKTAEYRLYRSVDGAEPTLLGQGVASYAAGAKIEFTDDELPAHGAQVGYFVQLLDAQGNASPFVKLGQAPTLGLLMPPAPKVYPAAQGPTGTELTWYCAPAGVERFEIELGCWPPTDFTKPAGSLSDNLAPAGNLAFAGLVNGLARYVDMRVFRTAGVAASGGGPLFQLPVTLPFGREWYFRVRALGINGQAGPASELVSFAKSPALIKLAGPQVPWPARPEPPVRLNFHPDLQGARLPDAVFPGLGVRIGRVVVDRTKTTRANGLPGLAIGSRVAALPGVITAEEMLFHGSDGRSLLPFVLYRQQQRLNDADAGVSPKVVQVSPLVEKLQILQGEHELAGPTTILADPFLRGVVEELAGESAVVALYFLDTQPARRLSSYRYNFLRFKANGEVDDVVPVGPVLNDVPKTGGGGPG